jgi:hypothetical protein
MKQLYTNCIYFVKGYLGIKWCKSAFFLTMSRLFMRFPSFGYNRKIFGNYHPPSIQKYTGNSE